jgi:hypothetical protein
VNLLFYPSTSFNGNNNKNQNGKTPIDRATISAFHDDNEEEAASTRKRLSLKPAGKGSGRRCRSSARFLKLGDVAEDGDKDDDDDEQKECLSYKRDVSKDHSHERGERNQCQ